MLASKKILSAFLLLFLSACGVAGPVGPTGPQGDQGPAGPGTQTSYSFSVIPDESQEIYDFACPAVVANSTQGTYSTVQVYFTRTGWSDHIALPAETIDAGPTTTWMTYSIYPGHVMVLIENSGSTVVDPLTFIITVVNPN